MKKLLASLSFFTRIPFWRLATIPADKYRNVVDLWPAAGILTGALTALLLWGASFIVKPFAAVTLAMSFRAFLTCAFHEDGLADFFDGMGGGSSRSRILEIMKDSHIGSYGVISLILYYILTISFISSLPIGIACLAIFGADPWSKFCGACIINFLPYARKEEEAKNKLVYNRMGVFTVILCFLLGFLPMLLLPRVYWVCALLPFIVSMILILIMKRKIGGYTGDCCGATALLCELAFYFSAAVVYHLSIS